MLFCSQSSKCSSSDALQHKSDSSRRSTGCGWLPSLPLFSSIFTPLWNVEPSRARGFLTPTWQSAEWNYSLRFSGFILGVPFASRYLLNTPRVNLKQYFLRRLTRLAPPYFISLFVCVAATMVDSNRSVNDMVPHLLASLAYIHNLIFGGAPWRN